MTIRISNAFGSLSNFVNIFQKQIEVKINFTSIY